MSLRRLRVEGLGFRGVGFLCLGPLALAFWAWGAGLGVSGIGSPLRVFERCGGV